MTEQEIRAAHPDWTDEQVAAEVARSAEKPDPTPAPTPATGTGDDAARDAAFARERRAREEAERRAKQAEDKVAEQERKKAEEEGQFKELAGQEKARADRLEAEKAAETARRHAEQTAGSLKFKDPGYALYLLAEQGVDFADAAAVRAALEQTAADRKDLIAGFVPPPSGGPAGGGNNEPPGLTKEQIEAMSPRQLAAIPPETIKKALGQT